MAKPFAPQLHEGANQVRSPLRFPKYPNQKTERVGFEPTVQIVHRLSRSAP